MVYMKAFQQNKLSHFISAERIFTEAHRIIISGLGLGVGGIWMAVFAIQRKESDSWPVEGVFCSSDKVTQGHRAEETDYCPFLLSAKQKQGLWAESFSLLLKG